MRRHRSVAVLPDFALFWRSAADAFAVEIAPVDVAVPASICSGHFPADRAGHWQWMMVLRFRTELLH
jgi:hypothetical protein